MAAALDIESLDIELPRDAEKPNVEKERSGDQDTRMSESSSQHIDDYDDDDNDCCEAYICGESGNVPWTKFLAVSFIFLALGSGALAPICIFGGCVEFGVDVWGPASCTLKAPVGLSNGGVDQIPLDQQNIRDQGAAPELLQPTACAVKAELDYTGSCQGESNACKKWRYANGLPPSFVPNVEAGPREVLLYGPCPNLTAAVEQFQKSSTTSPPTVPCFVYDSDDIARDPAYADASQYVLINSTAYPAADCNPWPSTLIFFVIILYALAFGGIAHKACRDCRSPVKMKKDHQLRTLNRICW